MTSFLKSSHVYVIQTASQRVYVGASRDVQTRLRAHRRAFGDYDLLGVIACGNMVDASNLEKVLIEKAVERYGDLCINQNGRMCKNRESKLYVTISDDVENKFRYKVGELRGAGKGIIRQAINEALELWIDYPELIEKVQ